MQLIKYFRALQETLLNLEKELRTNFKFKPDLEYYLDIPFISCARHNDISCPSHNYRQYPNNSIHLWYDSNKVLEQLVVVNRQWEENTYNSENISAELTNEIIKFIKSSRSESESKVLALKIQKVYMKPAKPTDDFKSFINRYKIAETELEKVIQQQLISSVSPLHKLFPNEFEKFDMLRKDANQQLKQIRLICIAQFILISISLAFCVYSPYPIFDNMNNSSLIAMTLLLPILTLLLEKIVSNNAKSTLATIKEKEQSPAETLKCTFFGGKQMNFNKLVNFNKLTAVAEIIDGDRSQLPSLSSRTR